MYIKNTLLNNLQKPQKYLYTNISKYTRYQKYPKTKKHTLLF